MLNTQANLFTLLLSPLECGGFERLNTDVTGLGEAVRNEEGREERKLPMGKREGKGSEIPHRREKIK